MEKLFYYAQVIGGLHILFSVICVIGGFAAVCTTIGAIYTAREADDDDYYSVSERQELLLTYKNVRKWAVRLWCILVVAVMGNIFIPTKQTFLFMVGGRAVDNMIENKPEIKEIPGNTFELLNEYIKAETDKIRRKAEDK